MFRFSLLDPSKNGNRKSNFIKSDIGQCTILLIADAADEESKSTHMTTSGVDFTTVSSRIDDVFTTTGMDGNGTAKDTGSKWCNPGELNLLCFNLAFTTQF